MEGVCHRPGRISNHDLAFLFVAGVASAIAERCFQVLGIIIAEDVSDVCLVYFVFYFLHKRQIRRTKPFNSRLRAPNKWYCAHPTLLMYAQSYTLLGKMYKNVVISLLRGSSTNFTSAIAPFSPAIPLATPRGSDPARSNRPDTRPRIGVLRRMFCSIVFMHIHVS